MIHSWKDKTLAPKRFDLDHADIKLRDRCWRAALRKRLACPQQLVSAHTKTLSGGTIEWQLWAVSDTAPVNAERLLSRLRSNKLPDRSRPCSGHSLPEIKITQDLRSGPNHDRSGRCINAGESRPRRIAAAPHLIMGYPIALGHKLPEVRPPCSISSNLSLATM